MTCGGTLDVSRELARYLARLSYAERRDRGTRKGGRVLTCHEQAVLGLRWFRQNTDITALARDHGISRATGYRYLAEVVTVLADRAPDLHDALRQAKADGLAHVILDGKFFSADRLVEKTTSVTGEPIDLWYSGKAHGHGGNIQALTAPNGFPPRVGDVEPGSVHDLTAAPATSCYAAFAASVNAASPCSPDAGAHYDSSPPAHARSATSSKPPSP